MGNGDKDILRARLRKRQTLPLQVGMAMGYTLGIMNGNEEVSTHQADTFTKSGASRKRIQDMNGRLE